MTTTDELFGPYRLGALLGRGGMGEVYRATDTSQNDRVVALKLLAPHLSADDNYRTRFRRECETAGRLDEPHVVPIHRYGEIEGRLFLDMQLVDGCDLATELERGPMHPARAVGVVEQVAAALDAAHRAGLVHRDVKPSNILLRMPAPGRPDFAQLTDFGIAAGPGGDDDASGTVEYLAPERLLGAPADHRADVYALACVLYELLTGLQAFPGAEFAAQLYGHLHLPPPRPTDAFAGLPPGLDQVVARGMAKDPGNRYPSAGALADDALAALRTGPTVMANSAAAAGPRRTSRRGLLVGASGALVLAGGGALGVALTRNGAQPGVAAASAPPEPVIAERVLGVRSTSHFPFSTTQISGRPAIFIDSLDSGLRLRDLTTDSDVLPPIRFASVAPYTAEVLDIDGRPALVVAAIDGEISAVDVQTLAEVPVGAHGSYILGLTAATVRGRPIAATIGEDELVRRWDLRTRTPLGQPMQAPGIVVVGPLATTVVMDRTYLVAEVLGRNLMYVWDLETGGQVATPNAIGEITRLAGTPVVVDTSRDIVVNDLHTGTQLRRHDADPTAATALAVVDGRPVVAAQGPQNTVVIRDIDTGAQLGAALEGHQAELTKLGVAGARVGGERQHDPGLGPRGTSRGLRAGRCATASGSAHQHPSGLLGALWCSTFAPPVTEHAVPDRPPPTSRAPADIGPTPRSWRRATRRSSPRRSPPRRSSPRRAAPGSP